MAAPECGGSDGYCELRDVRVELDPGMSRGDGGGGKGGGFTVCFWLYLSGSARPSSVILHQITVGDDNKLPFLALSEGNKLLLFPLLRLHREAPTPASSYPWTDTTNLSAVKECPLEKWIHIGCEKSAGGVLLPKSAVKFERYLMGEILSVGADVSEVEAGKKVLFSDINAYEVDLGTDEKHCFCRESDLLAIVE